MMRTTPFCSARAFRRWLSETAIRTAQGLFEEQYNLHEVLMKMVSQYCCLVALKMTRTTRMNSWVRNQRFHPVSKEEETS